MGRIPKIIHYCWVGGKEKPVSVQYCIDSWKKHCPDYEIKEWNETNYDFTKNRYMKQAYEAGKWGFVPDYARLDIIYEYGGIYFDTDVELLKSYDQFLDEEAFMGFENTGDGVFFVNCGQGFGAVPHHEMIRSARDFYNDISFVNDDGSLNMVPSPFYTTRSLRQFGLVQEDRDQKLSGMHIFASDVFCPKTFRTGKLNITERSVSIHHFTASWMDEKIKEELLHQQEIERHFGHRLGKYALLVESVFEKYNLRELFTKLPLRILKRIKWRIVALCESGGLYIRLFMACFVSTGTKPPVLLDTAGGSDNEGDRIIMESCLKELPKELAEENVLHIPTHRFSSDEEKQNLKSASCKILCGTNILSGEMRSYGLWKMDVDIAVYKNTVLMGVGFDSDSEESSRYTRGLFRVILSKSGFHSVRDTFSEMKLKRMGIHNVLYTGCPSMWRLTKEHCEQIPHRKARNVVCTLTDYNRDSYLDKKMLDILLDSYDKVFFWPQGDFDEDYIRDLERERDVYMIPSGLENYDALLKQEELDYVGTRLHAGIRALNTFHRSIIVSIDNRAECIAKDTGLHIIHRDNIPAKLKDLIFCEFATEIRMPWENIHLWKSSLKEICVRKQG